MTIHITYPLNQPYGQAQIYIYVSFINHQWLFGGRVQSPDDFGVTVTLQSNFF